MNTLKKSITAFALAALMLPALIPTTLSAQAVAQEGPIETYLTCVEKCMDKYPAWSLRLSACSMDCYFGIYSSLVKALVP